MLKLKDFYFLRHGETDWNREHRGMGQKDISLNSKGIQQAHDAAILLASEPIDLICHSPLSRAKVTAEIISNKLQKPMKEISELIECSWGDFEGRIKGQWTEDWIAGVDIPGAESYENFLKRALLGINKAISCDRKTLIVAHGGVFWAVQKYAQIGSRFDLGNCKPVFLRAPPVGSLPWGLSSVESNDF